MVSYSYMPNKYELTIDIGIDALAIVLAHMDRPCVVQSLVYANVDNIKTTLFNQLPEGSLESWQHFLLPNITFMVYINHRYKLAIYNAWGKQNWNIRFAPAPDP